MSRKTIGLCTLAALAASASSLNAEAISSIRQDAYAAASATLPPESAVRSVCSVNVTGTNSWDAEFAAVNAQLTVDVATCAGLPAGTAMVLTGVGWNVTLFADPSVGSFGGSWLEEMFVKFYPTGGGAGSYYLNPGAGAAGPGTQSFVSSGIQSIPSITLPTGLLSLEFFESFDDQAGVVDGVWTSGNVFRGETPSILDLQVTLLPEPAALTMLLVGIWIRFPRRN